MQGTLQVRPCKLDGAIHGANALNADPPPLTFQGAASHGEEKSSRATATAKAAGGPLCFCLFFSCVGGRRRDASGLGAVGSRGVRGMDAAAKPQGWVHGVPANHRPQPNQAFRDQPSTHEGLRRSRGPTSPRQPHVDHRAEHLRAHGRARSPSPAAQPSAATTIGCAGNATACSVPRALARYCTCIPFGIQRMPFGSDASTINPAVSSARLHIAIACTVPMWLHPAAVGQRAFAAAVFQAGDAWRDAGEVGRLEAPRARTARCGGPALQPVVKRAGAWTWWVFRSADKATAGRGPPSKQRVSRAIRLPANAGPCAGGRSSWPRAVRGCRSRPR